MAAERDRLRRRVRLTLPASDSLHGSAWWPRHRSLLVVLWGHLAAFAVIWTRDLASVGMLLGVAAIAAAAAAAAAGPALLPRRARSLAVTAGLLGCSVMLVHLTGGSTETFFHFFVVLALVGLYQDWLGFVLAIGFVFLHNTLGGGDAGTALIHAGFVATAGLAHIHTWRHFERAGVHAEHALSATGEGIYGIDERGIVTFANPAAARALRCDVADLLGRHHHEAFGHALAGGDHPAADECATCMVVDATCGTRVRDHLFNAAGSSGFPVELVSTPIELRGDVTGSMVAFRDITAHDELRRRAYTDPLTGLPNRTLLLDHLEETLGRRRRTDALAVLFLDLDRFKVVNDTLGHAAGDALLVGVADRLRHVVRPSDIIGRLGGDEFVVICEGVTDRDHAAGVAHRVLAGFDEPFDIGRDEPLVIRPSIGVVVPSHDATDSPDDFLRKADAAMYRAKQQGRGCVQLFEDGQAVPAAR